VGLNQFYYVYVSIENSISVELRKAEKSLLESVKFKVTKS
jgi:hypothetical protein